jgi:hypothetical protein
MLGHGTFLRGRKLEMLLSKEKERKTGDSDGRLESRRFCQQIEKLAVPTTG